MSSLSSLKASNGEHSIKEAVISLFLANPIVKPERFGSLIEGSFSNDFQQYEPVHFFKVEFKNFNGLLETKPASIDNNAGFRFTRFSKGKPATILQSRNEDQRTFISFHTFDYSRWDPFFLDFQDIIKRLSENQSNLFVKAFSLHYIDEFNWIDPVTPVPVSEIFNNESVILPSEFFNSLVNQYQITSQKKVEDYVYIDRLEININKTAQSISNIFISHNITQTINDVQELSDLIQNSLFLDMLQKAHEHNKDVLKSVLKEEVKNNIGLK